MRIQLSSGKLLNKLHLAKCICAKMNIGENKRRLAATNFVFVQQRLLRPAVLVGGCRDGKGIGLGEQRAPQVTRQKKTETRSELC